MTDYHSNSAFITFTLVYLTVFLDNVLLTVLVPIIPDWVRGEALELWSRRDAPLAALLNGTVHRADAAGGAGASQAAVGAVLSAKALCQLASSPLAARAVTRRGPAAVLRLATGALAAAALVFPCCGQRAGWRAAVCAGAGRALHGAGSALAAVGGLALVTAALRPPARDRALAALLGAVALGVLVGYPCGGIAGALGSRGAPFLLLAIALATDLALQLVFLKNDEHHKPNGETEQEAGDGWRNWWSAPAPGGACAGAVLCTTSVMAALEPCLPLWIRDRFGSGGWQAGAVFLPDSAGYLAGTTAAGALGARAAVTLAGGQLAVAAGALWVPLAGSVRGLAPPHALLGCGLGALDAALVPALVGRDEARAPHAAALLQAASSAAYVLGPVCGGLVSWACGFESALRALAVLNLLYACYLRSALAAHPLSPATPALSAAA